MSNIEDTLRSQPIGTFCSFHSLLTAVSMQYALDGQQPITLFAVPDQTFGRMRYGTVYELLKDIPKLNTLMAYHIVIGGFTMADMRANAVHERSGETYVQLETMLEHPLTVQPGRTANEARIGQARIIQPDIRCDNGIIHIIDNILWPPGLNLEAFGERSQIHSGRMPTE